jgi:hypothetical protein
MYDIDLHSLLKADEGNGYVILAGDYRSIQTQFEQGDKTVCFSGFLGFLSS